MLGTSIHPVWGVDDFTIIANYDVIEGALIGINFMLGAYTMQLHPVWRTDDFTIIGVSLSKPHIDATSVIFI